MQSREVKTENIANESANECTIRFLHSGDVHLGACARGLRALNEHWEERLLHVQREAFDRLIRAALTSDIDFLILAGDTFDTTRASYGDFLYFFEAMEKLAKANILVFMVGGNHDPYTSWAKDIDRLPDNVHFMGANANAPEFYLYEKQGKPACIIGARSYFNQTWPDDKDIAEGITRVAAEQALYAEHPRVSEAPFSVGIIHTALDTATIKAPTNRGDLLSRGIDYWACGHLHQPIVWPNKHEPRIVFSGSVQPCSIRERGKRGCYLVTMRKEPATRKEPVDASSKLASSRSKLASSSSEPTCAHTRIDLQFVPLASVVMQRISVDVSTSQTLADVLSHVQTALFAANGKAHCEDMLVHVTLEGPSDLCRFLGQPDVLERLRESINEAYPSFYCDVLINRTTSPDYILGGIAANVSDSESEETVVEESDRAAADNDLFLQILQDIAGNQYERREEMINYVQAGLVKRGVAIPGALSRNIDELEEAAFSHVMNLLEEAAL